MESKHNRTVYQRPDGTWANKVFDEEIPTTIHETRRRTIAAAKASFKTKAAEGITRFGTRWRSHLQNNSPSAKTTYPINKTAH